MVPVRHHPKERLVFRAPRRRFGRGPFSFESMDATNARRLHDPVLREIQRREAWEAGLSLLSKQYEFAEASVDCALTLLRTLLYSISAAIQAMTRRLKTPRLGPQSEQELETTGDSRRTIRPPSSSVRQQAPFSRRV